MLIKSTLGLGVKTLTPLTSLVSPKVIRDSLITYPELIKLSVRFPLHLTIPNQPPYASGSTATIYIRNITKILEHVVVLKATTYLVQVI